MFKRNPGISVSIAGQRAKEQRMRGEKVVSCALRPKGARQARAQTAGSYSDIKRTYTRMHIRNADGYENAARVGGGKSKKPVEKEITLYWQGLFQIDHTG